MLGPAAPRAGQGEGAQSMALVEKASSLHALPPAPAAPRHAALSGLGAVEILDTAGHWAPGPATAMVCSRSFMAEGTEDSSYTSHLHLSNV